MLNDVSGSMDDVTVPGNDRPRQVFFFFSDGGGEPIPQTLRNIDPEESFILLSIRLTLKP